MKAKEHLEAGDTDAAMAALQAQVRDAPADAALRVFLFQLLCVRGEWSRALTQLNVAADLDADTLLMAQTYRELLHCEAFRQAVFRGEQQPLIFGEPPAWVAPLIDALPLLAAGNAKAASSQVHKAFEQSAARTGSIDGVAFEWLSDADMRLGPVVEAVIAGRYYWIPTSQITAITLSPPEDLRDLVWLPVHFTWVTDGTSIGFMPVRYPGDPTSATGPTAMARATEWHDAGSDFYLGGGQRMFTSGNTDFPMLATRKILFDNVTD